MLGLDLGRTLGARRVFTDGGRDAQTLRLESNIASRTVGVSRVINRDAGPDCSGARIEEPCSGQFSCVRALCPMLAAAVLACELAGLSWSAIHLSKLRIVAKRPGLIGSTGVSNLARACVVSIVERGPARRATQLECQQARVARRGLKRGENRVRAETNFASRINLIWVVQFFGAKYYFRFSEICASSLAIPPRCKGRFAIVTNVRWDAVAATERETSAFRLRTVKPCGSGAPKQASSSQDANASRG